MQFTELMIANIRLYALSNEQTLSTHAVANFTRQQLATALRKVRHPCLVISRPVHWACTGPSADVPDSKTCVEGHHMGNAGGVRMMRNRRESFEGGAGEEDMVVLSCAPDSGY